MIQLHQNHDVVGGSDGVLSTNAFACDVELPDDTASTVTVFPHGLPYVWTYHMISGYMIGKIAHLYPCASIVPVTLLDI